MSDISEVGMPEVGMPGIYLDGSNEENQDNRVSNVSAQVLGNIQQPEVACIREDMGTPLIGRQTQLPVFMFPVGDHYGNFKKKEE